MLIIVYPPQVLVRDDQALAEEREKIRQEYEQEMKKVHEQYLAEQDHKTKLQLDMEKLKQQYEEQLARLNREVILLYKNSRKTPNI